MSETTVPTSSRPSCARCTELERENAALRSQLDEFRQELEKFQRAGKRQAAPFSRGTRKEKPSRPGRKKGHPGAKREKPDRVDRTLEAPALESCPECGRALEAKRQEENYETEIPPVEPRVTRFVFASGWCPCCKRRVYSRHEHQSSTATGAAASHLGPRVRALAADLKCRLGLPFRKIRDLLEDQFGIRVTAGALAQSNERLSHRAEPTLKALKAALAQEAVVGADETGWRTGGIAHWLWVVCSERFTVYEITPHRCAEVVVGILGEGFKGFLMRDGWRSYDARLVYQMLRCLRHLQRNAERLEEAQSGEAAAETIALFILWIDGVFALKKQQRTGELNEAQYQSQAEEFVEWLDEYVEEGSSSPANQKFVETLVEIREQIVPILEHPELPATNNQSERQIRPAVLHRKVSAGNKTKRGAQTLSTLASLAASCRQQLVNFAEVVECILTDPLDEPVLFWEQDDPAPT